jgi:sulfite reductase (ferredoxin)
MSTQPPTASTGDHAAIPERSAAELNKESSNYLRGDLAEQFAAEGMRLTDAGDALLKFHGSYGQDQRDERRARRAAGEEFAYSFMLRLRLPAGDIHPDLYLALDRLAGEIGNGTLRFTTRQSVQLHGILKGDLRTALKTVNANLATTLAACGDVNRNVMASPAPVSDAAYEIARETARRISAHLLPRTSAYAELWLDDVEVARIAPGVAPQNGATHFPAHTGLADDPATVAVKPLPGDEPLYGKTYLPRKFKVAVAVAGDNSVDLFTQDLAYVPILETAGDGAAGEQLIGFNVYVGGGLGRTHNKPATYPRLADLLGFIRPDDVLAVAEGVMSVLRDNGDRANRRHARLKYLIAERGIDWFRGEVEAAASISIGPGRNIDWHGFDDLLGWHLQADGRWFLGLRVQNGRVADPEGGPALRTALRELVSEHRLSLRLTPNQNTYLLDVPSALRPVVEATLTAHGVTDIDGGRGLRRLSMACPALPTCGLAVTEAERVLPEVLDQLQVVFDEAGLPDSTTVVRMTGCPNGCARPYVAEIGLVGDAVDRYQVWLGGDGVGTRLARTVADRVHKDDLPALLRPVVQRYAAERLPAETFGSFVNRASIERLDVGQSETPTKRDTPR